MSAEDTGARPAPADTTSTADTDLLRRLDDGMAKFSQGVDVTYWAEPVRLLREARERIAQMAQPVDATGQERLLLNAYGRKCYEAGERHGAEQAEAQLREAEARCIAAEAEVEHQRGHKAEYLDMLTKAEARVQELEAALRR